MSARRSRIGRWALGLGGLAAVIIWALGAQATTRQGVNFQVSIRPIPLSAKALDFLHRDAQYRLIAREVAGGLASDRERAQAVFDWTRRTIRRTPEGWPVVDDHVLNIIIRGHGLDDQMADAFTTISTYAGVPAFWRFLSGPDGSPVLVLSCARIDGTWAAFDVANGFIFADAGGRLVDLDTLTRDPAAVEAVAGDLAPSGMPYWQYVRQLRPFTVPQVLRAQLQMPWPRAAAELRDGLAVLSGARPWSGQWRAVEAVRAR